MRNIFVCSIVFVAVVAAAQTVPEDPAGKELRAGRGGSETRVFTAEEDQQILALFDGLRVADVSDGMDAFNRS